MVHGPLPPGRRGAVAPGHIRPEGYNRDRWWLIANSPLSRRDRGCTVPQPHRPRTDDDPLRGETVGGGLDGMGSRSVEVRRPLA
jgi:hypothetical protein